AAALAAAAVAVLTAPRPSQGLLRLRSLRERGADAAVRLPSLIDRPIVAATAGAGLTVGVACGVAMISRTSHAVVLPALAAACLGALAGWLSSLAATRRRDRRLEASLASAVAALPAELRSGQSEVAALHSVART